MRVVVCVPAIFFAIVTAYGALAGGPTPGNVGSARDTWTGFYAGAQVGKMWVDTDNQFVIQPSGSPITFSPDQEAGLWGGQIGYQEQFNSLVIGAEASYLASFNGSFGADSCHPLADCGGVRAQFESEVDHIFTVGPRLGWAVGSLMPYVTGGYANASIEMRNFDFGALVAESRKRHDGWFIGGGADWAILPHLFLGVEYRHYDFADETVFPIEISTGRVGDAFVEDAKADTVTARVSVKFGPGLSLP